MAEVFCNDIVEQILVRSDAEDIIRCKRVCKSWYSLITSSRFVNSHLKLNNTIGCRRRIVAFIPNNGEHILYILGSYNGLVCLLTYDRKNICVVNPCTREVKVKHLHEGNHGVFHDIFFSSYLGGFGYDSSSDDYQVILGRRDYKKDNIIRFYVLSLKSNVWKRVGKVRCVYRYSSSGILCNGALHWLIRDENDNNRIILSFDLSKEEFKEFSTPTDVRIEHAHDSVYRLGIIEECLCIYNNTKRGHPKWVLKNYNDNPYWQLVRHCPQWDDEVTHYLKILRLKTFYRTKNIFNHDECLLWTQEYISAPVFVQSLVSPHVNKR